VTRRLAVVTGAAGTIGRAIVAALAEDFEVIGVDRVSGDGVIAADITDRAALERVAQEITADGAEIAALVNNAGVLTMGAFFDLTDDDFDRVLSVNVTGTALASQVFGRRMADRGAGRIVNIASSAGKVPLPDQAHYCASKAAVIMLTRVMALELAAYGIQAYSVCPGAVDTALFRQCLEWTAERDGVDAGALLAEWLAPSRIGRFVEPEEVAALVRYLTSGPAEAMTGHAISVDGGVASW
jgi:meso-butanediol dehydrogenase / (S,S)-butanediol dehydrogenase / diacetyl reductase